MVKMQLTSSRSPAILNNGAEGGRRRTRRSFVSRVLAQCLDVEAFHNLVDAQIYTPTRSARISALGHHRPTPGRRRLYGPLMESGRAPPLTLSRTVLVILYVK